MKVLLIDPALPVKAARNIAWAPLGLAYLASALRRAGHEVTIHNRLVSKLKHQLDDAALDATTASVLALAQPDFVGISGPTASYADIAAVARMTRAARPDASIVLGGPHATAAPQATFERIAEADYLVVGEGEKTLVALADGQDAASLGGILWRDGAGGIAMNDWRPPEWDLDSIGSPARDLLDMEWFAAHASAGLRGSSRRTATMIGSRGCPHRCAFCSEPAYTVRGVRFHSARHTVAEAEEILEKYPADVIVFLDEMLMANRERALEICELWRSRGLHQRVKFAGQTRADALDGELLREMAAAGLYQLEIGVESGSDRMLQVMRKGLTVEQNRQAIRRCEALGIRVQLNLVAGAPGESEEELQASLDFVAEFRPAAVSLMPFLPLPNTEFVNTLIAEGRLDPDFWATEDRAFRGPDAYFADMPRERFDELMAEGRRLARDINAESWIADAPWWPGMRRRAGLALRKMGLRRA